MKAFLKERCGVDEVPERVLLSKSLTGLADPQPALERLGVVQETFFASVCVQNGCSHGAWLKWVRQVVSRTAKENVYCCRGKCQPQQYDRSSVLGDNISATVHVQIERTAVSAIATAARRVLSHEDQAAGELRNSTSVCFALHSILFSLDHHASPCFSDEATERVHAVCPAATPRQGQLLDAPHVLLKVGKARTYMSTFTLESILATFPRIRLCTQGQCQHDASLAMQSDSLINQAFRHTDRPSIPS